MRSLLQRMSFPRVDVPRIERATLALLADVEAHVPKITFGRSYLGVCSAGTLCNSCAPPLASSRPPGAQCSVSSTCVAFYVGCWLCDYPVKQHLIATLARVARQTIDHRYSFILVQYPPYILYSYSTRTLCPYLHAIFASFTLF